MDSSNATKNSSIMIRHGGRRINCAIEGDTACKIQLLYTVHANSPDLPVQFNRVHCIRSLAPSRAAMLINTNMHGTSTTHQMCHLTILLKLFSPILFLLLVLLKHFCDNISLLVLNKTNSETVDSYFKMALKSIQERS